MPVSVPTLLLNGAASGCPRRKERDHDRHFDQLESGAPVVASWTRVRGVAGRIGLAILGYCAVASVGVGVFVTDPMSTPVENISTRGMLHLVFGFSALLLLPVAALLVTGTLARRHREGSWMLRTMRLVAFLPVAGLAGVWVPEVAGLLRVGGWPDRALFLTYTVWVLVVAAPLCRRGAGGRGLL